MRTVDALLPGCRRARGFPESKMVWWYPLVWWVLAFPALPPPGFRNRSLPASRLPPLAVRAEVRSHFPYLPPPSRTATAEPRDTTEAMQPNASPFNFLLVFP